MKYLLSWICLCVVLVHSAYQPELMLTASAHTLNEEINTRFGPNISEAINNYNLTDIHFEQKVEGINVKFNLTKPQQHVALDWKGNFLTIKDQHSFEVSSQNVNFTLDGMLEVKIGVTRRQKG